MSYAIYQTPAFVLKTKNIRESNKLVYLYTQKFGLIYASMQSLRELKSKMRYHIHTGAYLTVDLVEGKNIWRIVGAHEEKSAFHLVGTPWHSLFSVFSDTLVRLCDSEEPNDGLWQSLDNFMNHTDHFYEVYVSEIELVVMIEFLYALGYWQEDDTFFHYPSYEKELFDYIKKNKKILIQKINHSLAASQL